MPWVPVYQPQDLHPAAQITPLVRLAYQGALQVAEWGHSRGVIPSAWQLPLPCPVAPIPFFGSNQILSPATKTESFVHLWSRPLKSITGLVLVPVAQHPSDPSAPVGCSFLGDYALPELSDFYSDTYSACDFGFTLDWAGGWDSRRLLSILCDLHVVNRLKVISFPIWSYVP